MGCGLSGHIEPDVVEAPDKPLHSHTLLILLLMAYCELNCIAASAESNPQHTNEAFQLAWLLDEALWQRKKSTHITAPNPI